MSDLHEHRTHTSSKSSTLSPSITQQTNLISNLPPDCAQIVFAHLSLHDCLSYGTTSISSLRDILADIERRQRRLHTPFPCSKLGLYYREVLDLDDNDGKEEEGGLVLQTTLLERVRCLYQSLPSGYPMEARVKELLTQLAQDEEGMTRVTVGNEEKTKNEGHGDGFAGMAFLRDLLRLTAGHRLHAKAVSDVVRLEPIRYEGVGSLSRASLSYGEKQRILTVTLEQYIGDVLCTYFLIEHTAAGIPEGGPSQERWISETLSAIVASVHSPNSDKGSITAVQWYRTWVLLHSMVLRTVPLPKRARKILSIPKMNHKSTESDSFPSATSCTSKICFSLVDDSEYVYQLGDVARCLVPLNITYNSFGRLGPTFRGRDHILVDTIDASHLVHAIARFLNVTYHLSDASRSTIDSLVDMHLELKKTRPLTVSPPLVTIDCLGL